MTQKKKTTKSSARPKTKTVAKKAKLQNLTQTNGKLYEKKVNKIRKLEEIFEIKKNNPFGTEVIEVFEKDLASMNLTEMQSVAVKAGVFPSGNKTVLKNKLIKEFKSQFAAYNQIVTNEPPRLDPKNPKHQAIIEYLNEG